MPFASHHCPKSRLAVKVARAAASLIAASMVPSIHSSRPPSRRSRACLIPRARRSSCQEIGRLFLAWRMSSKKEKWGRNNSRPQSKTILFGGLLMRQLVILRPPQPGLSSGWLRIAAFMHL